MKRPGLLAGLVFGAIVASCTEDAKIGEGEAARKVASTFCDQVFDCTCLNSAGFSSREACYNQVLQRLLEQQAQAVNVGLWYDASCVRDTVDSIEDLGCSRDVEKLEGQCDACFTYHGGVPAGEPCLRIGPYSSCVQGNACVAHVDHSGNPIDICMPVCERVGQGKPCKLNGPNYAVLRTCAEGLVCDAEGTALCVPLPAPGQPCWAGALCNPHAWCDASTSPAVCAGLKNPGEGCRTDVECKSGWCRDGARCDNPFPEASPCVNAQDRCAVGLACVNQVCRPHDAIICMSPEPIL